MFEERPVHRRPVGGRPLAATLTLICVGLLGASGAPADPVPGPAPGSAPGPAPGSGTGPVAAAVVARPSGPGLAIPGTTLLYADDASLDAQLRGVAASGVRWLRFDAPWTQLEPAPGRRDFSNLDRVLGRTSELGLAVDLVLGTVPDWARPAGTDWRYGAATADQRAGFAAFGAAVADRYRGRVAAYEIWNEPNLPGSWAPKPDADAYLHLLRQAYAAIRAVDRDAVVLAGGTGGGPTAVPSVAWYASLYRGGLSRHCDAVAVHPYPDAPAVRSGEMSQAFKVRALMNANGDAAKRLWGTEVGAPTGGRPSVAERVQADLVTRLYQLWSTVGNQGPLMFYTLQDGAGSDREAHFGLLRADGAAKPAFAALQALIDE